MGKFSKVIKNKLDLNHDGVVNMNDFKLEMKKFLDKNKDGHLSSEEVVNEVINIVTTVQEIKKM